MTKSALVQNAETMREIKEHRKEFLQKDVRDPDVLHDEIDFLYGVILGLCSWIDEFTRKNT
jgi:hypothetical protein